jgi:hypothetical protein
MGVVIEHFTKSAVPWRVRFINRVEEGWCAQVMNGIIGMYELRKAEDGWCLYQDGNTGRSVWTDLIDNRYNSFIMGLVVYGMEASNENSR